MPSLSSPPGPALVHLAAAAILAALQAAVPAARADDAAPNYAAYGQGAFLSFIDTEGEDVAIERVPRLLVSFGLEPRPIVVDTGSTGIVVSAGRIPDVDRLPSRPGTLTYSSSGRIMVGDWVTVPVTVLGRGGASIETRPMPVLAVTRIACMDQARDCMPNDHPKGVAMMGIGFGREHDRQSDSTPDKNPFLNVAWSGRDPNRRGYVVTRNGVHVGLTRANTRGPFQFVKLAPDADVPQDWTGAPVCMTVNGEAPATCGSALIDTGVTAMFLSLPPDRVAAALKGGELVPGTRIDLSFGAPAGAPAAAHVTVTVGEPGSTLAPTKIHLDMTRAPFVNTGVRMLNGFDVLYDADGGYVGYRPLRLDAVTR